MASRITTATTIGIDATLVDVETEINRGLPNFFLVGLPDTAVQEARERVRSGIKNSGEDFPTQRITVSLAPADVRKEGPAFDVPIAVSILVASGVLAPVSPGILFLGELSLSGALRGVSGVLPMIAAAHERGIAIAVVPEANAAEAALVQGITILPARHLTEIIAHLHGTAPLAPASSGAPAFPAAEVRVDVADIAGQDQAKRALEIAAAGGHNILLSGPPGSGKTMLANALAGLLPPMSFAEAIDVTRVYSVAGLVPEGEALMYQRPFRSPHHSASAASIVGGGRVPRPGEISLAHRGVLFLDEFPEFPRIVLEALREPLEDGRIVVSRVAGSCEFPARLLLVAAMNPCPCGFFTDNERPCTCLPQQLAKYQKRLSGPLLDRIDLHVPVPRVAFQKLSETSVRESTAVVRERVAQARAVQSERYRSAQALNGSATSAEMRTLVPLDDASTALLRAAVQRLHLSARGYYRILKVARTIADLEASSAVHAQHIAEALSYRQI